MKSKYLLRFDDICPTMNWNVWNKVEEVLIKHGIKPLLAVVPDCQDKNLKFSKPETNFWDRVRQWDKMGWTIAMHGYQHMYVTKAAGVLGIQRESEFAGLSDGEQCAKIEKSQALFRKEGLDPQIFVAPSHSFDEGTMRALQKYGINTISDGFGYVPYADPSGMLFIPQQMWRFRAMPPGVWTVCLHHNHWTDHEVHQFQEDVKKYSTKMSDFSEIQKTYAGRGQSMLGTMASGALKMAFKIKRAL